MMLNSFQDISALLYRNFQSAPDKVIFHYPNGNRQLTNAKLFLQAQSIAAYLQSRYQKGDRVMLMFPTGEEFVYSLFGVLMAGMVAIPVYTPKKNSHSERVDLIMKDAEPRVLLTTRKIADYLRKNFAYESDFSHVDLGLWEDMPAAQNTALRPSPAAASDIAFLQYTSGSTGNPKGVMVSHGNLLANLADLYVGSRQSEATIMVSWLPFFHDLGLISAIFLPVYGNFICHLTPPVEFINNPLVWIQMLSDYRATHTVAPNFAYDLCIRHYDSQRLQHVNLASVEYLGNCAEPVRAKTVFDFLQIYRNHHLNNVMSPGYGLAEATLKVSAVSVPSPGLTFVYNNGKECRTVAETELIQVDELDNIFVGCGHSAMDTDIAIVHPESLERLTDGQIGEIWVAGETVAQGYWNDERKTVAVFQARLGSQESKCFLRTGDLGFLSAGELYVSGRLKDLIIIRGTNFYPQDIEFTIERIHPAIRKGAVVAFSVTDEAEERLILMAEVDRHYLAGLATAEIFEAVRNRISRSYQLEVSAIVLVGPSVIPKTSSGKVKRSDCKRMYLDGGILPLAIWSAQVAAPTSTSAKQALLPEDEACTITAEVFRVLQSVLHLDHISLSANIYELGIDSITSVKIIHQLEAALQMTVPVTLIFSSHSLGELIGALKSIQANPAQLAVQKPTDHAQTSMSTVSDTQAGMALSIDEMSEQSIDDFLKSLMA